MAEPEVVYRTKLPDNKLPYYRLTIYLDEFMEDPELVSWYNWMKQKAPCCIAMGTGPGCFGKLAVWVWGAENGEEPLNAEEMGRVVMSSNWPAEVDNG